MSEASAILTWPLLVSQLAIFGTAAFALMLAPATIDDGRHSSPSFIAIWRALAVVIVIISPMLFIAMASGMAQITWTQVPPLIPQIVRETYAGRLWMWRFGAVAMLAIVAWVPERARFTSAGLMAISAILILLGSLISHAIDKGPFAVAIYCVHQMAAGIWLGALASLLIASRRADAAHQWIEIDAMTARVSSVCGWSVAVMLVSGPYTAFERLGWNLKLLSDSAYGRTLLLKLAIATPALILGAYNRYRLVPTVAEARVRAQLVRSVMIECVLLIAVMGWSAVLANTPPPH